MKGLLIGSQHAGSTPRKRNQAVKQPKAVASILKMKKRHVGVIS